MTKTSTTENPLGQTQLLNWYKKNHRPLPWRVQKAPYLIWVSEVMLQQTTTAAVVPYFEKFIRRFPTIESLSESSMQDVLEHWAGLGYYSRAKNLHQASQQLSGKSFPRSYKELIKLPGFGPYTSRAVSSLAFGEKVGVLDGNVIRVFCRLYGLKIEWWKTAEKNALQKLSDSFNQKFPSSQVNQALMELGATVCTPQKPRCFTCPWTTICIARKKNLQAILPLKKARKKPEIWTLQTYVSQKNKKVALVENNYAPFLKKQWILPGQAQKKKVKPKNYHFHHTITCHKIFVQVESLPPSRLKNRFKADKQVLKWVEIDKVKSYSPSSLVQKALYWHKANSLDVGPV